VGGLAEVDPQKIGGVLVTIRRMMAVVGIAIVLFIGLATPASAHDTDLYWRSHQAYVRGHTTISIYDQVCNPGQVVYTHYYVSTIGGLVPYDLYAPCQGTATRSHHPQQITKYQICEVGIGCSAYKYT
jgi:hypothetical protein